MLPSAFNPILEQLIRDLPGALGAIFLDWEGEAVDLFDDTETETPIKLIGAHFGILYYLFQTTLGKIGMGPPLDLVLGFESQIFIICRVTSHYLMVVTLGHRCDIEEALRQCKRTVRLLREEME